MSIVSLVLHSLQFYWRTTLGVFAGATLASAILIGALAVGDSVRYTLEQQALARVGRVQLALSAPDRFFREDLATSLMNDLATPVAPLLVIRGTVSKPDGTRLAANVQIVGVNDRFWQLGSDKDLFAGAGAGDAAANEQLALQLGAQAGDTLVVRVEEPSYISRDAPLSGRSDTSTAFRVQLRAIAGEAQSGRFSLQPSQISPMTLFMPLQALQGQLKRAGGVNTLLVGGDVTLQRAEAALRKQWSLADADLELREIPGELELRTARIFLDPPIAESAKSVVPGAKGVLTYLVNELRSGERATPYSMVTATEFADLGDDEIIINSWLADDLGAKVGDELTLRYFVVAEQRKLKEESRRFRVSEIKPLESPDTSWTPPFPGVSEVENCRDWDPGIPIETSRIRPKDEEVPGQIPRHTESIHQPQDGTADLGQSLRKFDRDPVSSAAQRTGTRANAPGKTRSGAARSRIPAGARPGARSRAAVDGLRTALYWLQLFLDRRRAAADGDVVRL